MLLLFNNKGGEELKEKKLRANIILLFVAAIWGFAFVAQRQGSDYVGAFIFNGIRFALGGLSLLPLIFYMDKKNEEGEITTFKEALLPGIIIGLMLFTGSSLQQVAIPYTTVGKASFITGLYIVFVPIIGLFLKHKISKNSWAGVAVAVIGLYLLSVNEDFTIGYGDGLLMISAIIWSLHILSIDNFTKKFDPLKLSCIQFATCGILSLVCSLIFEKNNVAGILQAGIPILYGSFLSVGVAFTLQVVAQKDANPSHASIIMSMESVFGAIGGAIILGEFMNARGYIGCACILAGIIISQIKTSQG